MKRMVTVAVLSLVLLSGCGGSGDRTPPGIRKGVKVAVLYYTHGSSDDPFVVEEVKGNWVFVKYEGDKHKPRWVNFDNVTTYRLAD